MKLLSPILLGLGLLSAAMASDNTNHLRTNTSARQLSTDSSGIGGGTWVWYLMLNGLNAVGDNMGGPDGCCCNDPPKRCEVLHVCLPHTHKHCSSGGGGSGSGSSGGGSGCSGSSCATSDGSSASSSSSNYSSNGDDSDSSYNKSTNDDYSGENDDGNNQANYYNNNDDGASGGNNNDNENTSTEEQYLEYNEYNEGSGYANQINGEKNLNIWPFLIAALVVGIVAAALMTKKRKQTANGYRDTLAKSVKRRMQYFQGGSSASVSLSQNGYDNES
jgi:hypothetical protein